VLTDLPQVPVLRRDLTLIVLSVLLMLLLISAVFWILRPFLLSVAWSVMIVVATWPAMLRVHAMTRRRSLAVAVMSGLMLIVFVAPVILAVLAVFNSMDSITASIHALQTATIPAPPDWISRIPLVGNRIAEGWTSIAALSKDELLSRVAPYAADAVRWLAGAFGSIGIVALQLLLTVVVSIVLFTHGEAMRESLLRFGRRLAGARGEDAVLLAGQAIRAVALGVVVTALVQTVLAGLGLALAGVPFAGLLTGIALLLCIAQIGPVLVLLPAVIWLYWTDANAWGTALLVWTIVLGALDNVLRPILIRKGADLPLMLILAGVIGGLLAFGIVGLFVGPVVLAVAYTLFRQWMRERDTVPSTEPEGEPRLNQAVR
jgi:predicted PurR-regulated permease PerM